jgi:hypothetical protein
MCILFMDVADVFVHQVSKVCGLVSLLVELLKVEFKKRIHFLRWLEGLHWLERLSHLIRVLGKGFYGGHLVAHGRVLLLV